MDQQGFLQDARPWATAASQWARASQHFVAMLDAIDVGDGLKATNEYLAAQRQIDLAKCPTVDDQGSDGIPHKNVIVPSVGDGIFEAFARKATAQFAAFLGVRPTAMKAYASTASSSMGQWQGNSPSQMVDGKLSTPFWSNVPPEKGSYAQVDLGSVKSVGQVAVHQADDDTASGDIFYHAAWSTRRMDRRGQSPGSSTRPRLSSTPSRRRLKHAMFESGPLTPTQVLNGSRFVSSR